MFELHLGSLECIKRTIKMGGGPANNKRNSRSNLIFCETQCHRVMLCGSSVTFIWIPGVPKGAVGYTGKGRGETRTWDIWILFLCSFPYAPQTTITGCDNPCGTFGPSEVGKIHRMIESWHPRELICLQVEAGVRTSGFHRPFPLELWALHHRAQTKHSASIVSAPVGLTGQSQQDGALQAPLLQDPRIGETSG